MSMRRACIRVVLFRSYVHGRFDLVDGGEARAHGADQSRNPGLTETRLRPLARRRDNTARPAFVFIRSRNPCVFERRRRFG